MDRFAEGTLPHREKFASRLRKEECSLKDYAHAEDLWKTFQCTTLQDYHDLYLQTDVVLLADVFEAFRVLCETTYGVDPVHYVSSPHLSWDSMLKLTACEPELLADPEIFRMLKDGLRGCVSAISKRFS